MKRSSNVNCTKHLFLLSGFGETRYDMITGTRLMTRLQYPGSLLGCIAHIYVNVMDARVCACVCERACAKTRIIACIVALHYTFHTNITSLSYCGHARWCVFVATGNGFEQATYISCTHI